MTALSWSVLVIGAALTVLSFVFGLRRLIGVRLPALRPPEQGERVGGQAVSLP